MHARRLHDGERTRTTRLHDGGRAHTTALATQACGDRSGHVRARRLDVTHIYIRTSLIISIEKGKKERVELTTNLNQEGAKPTTK